jgi:hypothetical protein
VTTAQASTLPWTFRLTETTRAPLPLVALGVAVAYMAVFLLLHNAAGAMDGFQMGGRPFWLDPFGWAAFIYVPLSGFLVVVGGYTLRAASANLRDLRPVLRLGPSEVERFETGLRRIDPWRLRVVGAAGVVVVEAFDAWLFWSTDPASRPQPWGWWVAAGFAQDLVFMWISFRVMGVFYELAHRFSQLGEHDTEIDLFDFRGIQPFTRMGLRLALLLVIGFAITAPYMQVLATAQDPQVTLSYGILWCLPVVFGAILVALTARGVHRAIAKAKAAELERVRTEIAREREAALGADEERKTVADQRLPGLLAYEARVERVREWPFDLPVLLRFGFYVLILLGSWVAGALVERALGLALD